VHIILNTDVSVVRRLDNASQPQWVTFSEARFGLITSAVLFLIHSCFSLLVSSSTMHSGMTLKVIAWQFSTFDLFHEPSEYSQFRSEIALPNVVRCSSRASQATISLSGVGGGEAQQDLHSSESSWPRLEGTSNNRVRSTIIILSIGQNAPRLISFS